jgi:branched-chain amino acid aminotransferase
MMSSSPVWLNDRFLVPGAAAIQAQDPGFLLGLAVFETFLCEYGRLFYLEEHLQRLLQAAQSVGIDLSAEFDPRAGLEAMAKSYEHSCAALRLTLTPGAPGAGPQVIITARDWQAPDPQGVRVLISKRSKVAGLGLENVKTTGRARNVLARGEAQAQGAYEALLCTEAGDLSEGTVSNLFLVSQGELITPPLGRGCLPGILRQKVMDLALDLGVSVHEKRVELSALDTADGLFLTSSLVRIQPVIQVLGREQRYPKGGDALTQRLINRLQDLESQG